MNSISYCVNWCCPCFFKRQTTPYPCYVFANPSSAGQHVAAAGAATSAIGGIHHHPPPPPIMPPINNSAKQGMHAPAGVCLPGYHYIDPVTGAKTPAMLQIPHPSTPMAPPSSSTPNVVSPGTPSMLNPSGSTHHHHPYIFLQPGQHSFLPQQGTEDFIYFTAY